MTFFHCDSIAMHPYLATDVPKRSEEPSGSFSIHETHYFVSLAENNGSVMYRSRDSGRDVFALL